jgi:transmembrane sensor
MSGELNRQLEAVRGLKVDWDDGRAARAERGMKRKRLNRRVAASLAVTVVLVSAGWLTFSARDPDVLVAPFNSTADVRVLPQEDGVEIAQLTAGGAWFDVRPNPNRTFRVEAGDVVVEVLGTRFAVDRAERGVRVLVDHGRVRVKWKGGERILTNGEDGWFPLSDSATASLTPEPAAPAAALEPEPAVAAIAEPAPEAQPAELPRPKKLAPAAKPKPIAEPASEAPTWQQLAKSGDHEAAFIALQRTNPADDPEELLLAADVARLSRHPDHSVAPLKQLLARHSADGRAPLAAFTLGRVLLDQLAQPAAAAEAFGRARALDPTGPLAEDALARHVGAAALAGNRDEATRLATEYLTQFPNGRSVRAVKHHGGLK